MKKRIGICHGTDGKGFALLSLFQRKQDEIWLQSAREFAMHALNQRNGRQTLCTSEAEFAFYLLACIDEIGDFPTSDYF